VVFAIEHTYKNSADKVVPIVNKTRARYGNFIRRQKLPVESFSIAPGLWPLGKSHADKSAWMTPKEFKQDLQVAYRATEDYGWIYGAGSAWQADVRRQLLWPVRIIVAE
jgi:hypothetical protein